MERLDQNQEREIKDFRGWLHGIDGPDDIFPPTAGVREPLRPLPPNLPPTHIELPLIAIAASALHGQRELQLA